MSESSDERSTSTSKMYRREGEEWTGGGYVQSGMLNPNPNPVSTPWTRKICHRVTQKDDKRKAMKAIELAKRRVRL